jgi:HD-GYP domain-containing protein (c-di-GMP phosphodiesterase class II)
LLDSHVERYRDLEVDLHAPALRERVEPRGAAPYHREVVERVAQVHSLLSRDIDKLYQSLATSASSDVTLLHDMAQDTLTRALDDIDVFVALGVNPLEAPSLKQYASRHALHVAMLAMGMGVTLGYDEPTIQSLGLGVLMHELGMLCLEKPVHERPGVLSDAEFAEIAKHPVRTFAVLERELSRVPMAARMVAYQLHERCDGSGYPRGRTRDHIHELARVAMVADVYVALVSDRPFRPALLPHSAVKHILYGVRDGQFDDQAARALLNTISLFPLGSFVRLSDQRIGQVLRAWGQPLDRPVISVHNFGHMHREPEILDLARVPELRIIGTLSSLFEKRT